MPPDPFAFALHAPARQAGPLARALGSRLPPGHAPADDAFVLTMRGTGLAVRLHPGSPRQDCRIMLQGTARRVGPAALTLAAAGAYLPTPPTAPPPLRLAPGQSPGDALAALLDTFGATLRHHAPGAIAAAGSATPVPEPVHQMRVTVRRLRSALLLFRRIARAPALAELDGELKALMRLLAPARDWDVFLTGTGAALRASLPDDARLASLLATAARHRASAYAALRSFLRGPRFAALGVRLAWLALSRPWEAPEPVGPAPVGPAPVNHDLARHAARMLNRRWAKMAAHGHDIAHLPEAALHELRLHGKRMRYACEFFAPLFAGRETARWVRRLARLQERLGTLNDGAVAADLVAALGPAGRGFAGGLVRGYVAAGGTASRPRIAHGWDRLRSLEPFWD